MMWDSQDYYIFFFPKDYLFLDFFENQKQKVKKKECYFYWEIYNSSVDL